MRSEIERKFATLMWHEKPEYEPGIVHYKAAYRPDFRMCGWDIEVKSKLNSAERKTVREVAEHYAVEDLLFAVAVYVYGESYIKPVNLRKGRYAVLHGLEVCQWLEEHGIVWFVYSEKIRYREITRYLWNYELEQRDVQCGQIIKTSY